MSIETTPLGTLIIIILMAVVTLITRWGGITVMLFIPFGYRVRSFLAAISGSVLVSVLAPVAVSGDTGAKLALFVSGSVMLITRKPLVAITAGVAAAAIIRGIG